jgi:gas vesicle protein
MFQSDHSSRNLFLGAFLGIAVGALTTLYLGTSGGKRLQKDVREKLQDFAEVKKNRVKKRVKQIKKQLKS